MLKRSLDILAACLLLALALPVLALAVIWIKIETGDPAIFRQMRMGRGFRPFRIYKLRTMRLGKGGPSYTFGRDPRITWIGHWLRRYKIDELPQLWNVIRGEMSLVGPRPVIPDLAHEFRDEYEQLLRVRPGLTDPATVKYCHESEMLAGEQDPMGTFKRVVTPDKLRLSLGYLERATFWTDLATLASTFRVVLTPVQVLVPHRATVLVFRPARAASASLARLEPVAVPAARRLLDRMEPESVSLGVQREAKKTGSGGWI